MESIQAIFIPDTETRLQPNKHTEYRIEVHAAVRKWIVWRRYSEFDKLNSQLRSLFPKHPPPIPLPGKNIFPSTFSRPDKIDERRQGLEKYLRGILSSRDDRWRETKVWKEFLAIPAGRALETTSKYTPESWLDEYNQLQSIVREVRSLVSRRTAHIAQTEISAAHNCTMQGKKLLLSLNMRLSSLESGLDRETLADGEARRRQDMLEELKEEKDALMKIVNTGRTVEGDNKKQAGEQKEQLVEQSPRKGRRAFGAQAAQQILARESQATSGLDNEALVKYQKQLMQDQDQHIEQFSAILTRQKQLGLAIGDELENQNHILDDLDDDVGRTGNKLKAARKKFGTIK